VNRESKRGDVYEKDPKRMRFTYNCQRLTTLEEIREFRPELVINAVTVKYTLSDTSLIIEYTASAEAKTPIALTNHAYFNLNGLGGNIYTHKAQIFADRYTEVDNNLIPTGEHPSVSETVFDLRTPKAIGDAVSDSFLGYDHNFVLSPTEFKSFAD
jgi:galactose mutarotase-like enzyme